MILAQLAPRFQQKTDWFRIHFSRERATWLALVVTCSAFFYGWGTHNYEAAQNAIKDEHHQIVAAKKEVVVAKTAAVDLKRHDDCVSRQAKVAIDVANSANGDPAYIPTCPPPPVVPKAITAVPTSK